MFGCGRKRFAVFRSPSPCGFGSRTAIAGVVYSISLRPEALRNGYDSLSHPAVTALPAVRGSLRSCVLRTCFAGRYRMGLIGQTSAGDFADVWMRPHSGSLLARRRRPAGLPSGQLSQGSYIPFLYGQGLEKWIRLPEARAMGARWAGGGKKLYGLNFYRRLTATLPSLLQEAFRPPLIVC